MVKLVVVSGALVALSAVVGTPRLRSDEAGIIASADRKAVLMIRRGASPHARLRIVAPTQPAPAGAVIVGGSHYQIVPSDVTLRKSAHFRISYNEGALPDGAAESDLKLLRYADGAWSEVGNASLNTTKNSLTANVRQLGGYAVGVLASAATP